MKVNKKLLEAKLKRHELPNGNFHWFIQRKIYDNELGDSFEYAFTVPDDEGKPSSKAIDYILTILDAVESIEKKSLNFIKGHLSIQSNFSLQGIEVLAELDRHEVQAILHFWCNEDGYLYTEIGLLNLNPHYLLVKYW